MAFVVCAVAGFPSALLGDAITYKQKELEKHGLEEH
jgi:hypothetical protein